MLGEGYLVSPQGQHDIARPVGLRRSATFAAVEELLMYPPAVVATLHAHVSCTGLQPKLEVGVEVLGEACRIERVPAERCA